MSNITIIVPIYNVEKYLRECLDSFVNQTDLNFDVILVNDGSKDSSGDIALEYVTKYPHLFTYIKQENKGLGGARNTGLRATKTKYVRFFDSDDFMAPRTMEKLNKELEDEELDVLFFYPAIYDMVTMTYQYWYDYKFISGIIKPNEKFSPHDYPILMEAEANVCRMVWNTEFLRQLDFKFIEHSYWEDVPAHFYLFYHAKKQKFLALREHTSIALIRQHRLLLVAGRTVLICKISLKKYCHILIRRISLKKRKLICLHSYLIICSGQSM